MKNLTLNTIKQLTVALTLGVVIIVGITALNPKNVYAYDGANYTVRSLNYSDDDTYIMMLQIDGIIDEPYRINIYHRNMGPGKCEFVLPLNPHIAMKLRAAALKGQTINGAMVITTNQDARWKYILSFNNAHIESMYSEIEKGSSGTGDICDRITISGEYSERYIY